ncbi:type II toxin-antitoxin system HigB family toxin [Flammeovirga sp. SJP92]|uniref:type II toxin-antitoxin system HigB family toxin n=1 Tax=Flammeovirga sp. SJP92 TaxID=1775430 RepID=UPI000786BDC6|nr:type II toxin-antitoxin system HigB family toxin [Flammeovirga sp. SJP92]KXX72756.1 hypothetical protein AVL50_32160 [Flammeovirga sp. SJP92]
MIIQKLDFIKEYSKKNNLAKNGLMYWYTISKSKNWKSVADLKADFPKVDKKNDLYIFNIKGNTYRLITKIDFDKKIIEIRFIGTHSEYDKLNLNQKKTRNNLNMFKVKNK